MTEKATITLAGVPYSVPRFNFGQRKRIAMLATTTFGYDMLAIALERSDPRVIKFDDVEPSQEEVVAAFKAINDLNGFSEATEQKSGEADAPALSGAS